MLRRTLPVGVATLAATLFSAPAPAAATTSTNAAASGQLTLFQNPDFTGYPQTVKYPGCDPQVFLFTGAFRSFDNQPAPGCRLVVIEHDRTHELCAGRDVVPGPPWVSPYIRIEAGDSVPCFFAAEGA